LGKIVAAATTLAVLLEHAGERQSVTEDLDHQPIVAYRGCGSTGPIPICSAAAKIWSALITTVDRSSEASRD